MSWDLCVQDWGGVKRLSEIPDDFEPQAIGMRSDLIKQIKEVEPLVDFEDESLGELCTDQFTIEFNMGNEELVSAFMIHVRGNKLAISVIGVILDKLALQATDGKEDTFFDVEQSKESFELWIDYKNKILNT